MTGARADNGKQLFETTTISDGSYETSFEVATEPDETTISAGADGFELKSKTLAFSNEITADFGLENTNIILNANSSVPPTVQYRFAYTQEDATEGGQVDVVSTIESDDLDEILTANGFNRSQVVSARVDSVQVDPVSTTSLSSADIYLGTDASGPQIASVSFPSGGEDAVVDTSRTPVTDGVESGISETFGRLNVEDSNSIPSEGSAVRATVYFRIEIEAE